MKTWVRMTMAGRGWIREFDSAIRYDIVRGLVEIITNSFDSYIRLNKSGVVEIFKNSRHYKVVDWAEGMTPEWMENVYHIYSGQFTAGMPTRGFFGRGAKDALYCMNKSDVRSFKDGKWSIAMLRWIDSNDKEVDYGLGEPAVKVTDLEIPSALIRKEYLMPYNSLSLGGPVDGNGTVVSFNVPDRYTNPRPDSLEYKLKKHYMLRKINTSPNFKIILFADSSTENIIRYNPPKGELVIEKSNEVLEINKIKLELSIKVWKSEQELEQTGDYRDGGLLIVDENDSVLDITLFNFEGNPFAEKIFGEVKIKGFRKVLELDETLLDDRRTGLSRSSELYYQLSSIIDRLLERIVEAERKKEESEGRQLNDTEKGLQKAVDGLNDIVNSELQSALPGGKITLPQSIPNGIAFYIGSNQVHSLNIIRGVTNHSNVYLLIDTRIINVNEKINFSLDNNDLISEISANNVSSPSKGYISIIKIGLKANENSGDNGNLSAKVLGKDGNVKLAVLQIIINDVTIPTIPNGFAFIPDNISVVDGKSKNVELWIDKNRIPLGNIEITSSNSQYVYLKDQNLEEGKWILGVDKFERYLNTDVYICNMLVEGNGIGEKAIITAKNGGTETNLFVEICSERKRTKKSGLFEEIKFTDDGNPNEKAHFEEELDKRIIYIHKHNPVINWYLERGKNDPGRQCIVAEAVADCACQTIAKLKFTPGVGSLIYQNPEDPIEEQIIEKNRIYGKYGKKMHQILSDVDIYKSLVEEEKAVLKENV